MKMYSHAIVSNSDMIKNYKNCRQMADEHGKVFILRNNQLDAVLFSISEYERVAVLLEYAEKMSQAEINNITETLQQRDQKNNLKKASVFDVEATGS